jgi:hypothetical protein
LCIREVSNHSFDVKTLSLWTIVSILSHLKSSSGKYFVVVSPSWVAHIDWSFSPLVKKLRGDSQSTSSGKCLSSHASWIIYKRVVPSKKSSSGSFVENLVSIDRRVLLVKRVVRNNFMFNFSYDWENEWFSVVISVGTDS